MPTQRSRDEVIAGLKRHGLNDADIAALLAAEAAAHPERGVPEPPATPTLRYRVRNWRDYDQALIQRGSLTLWVDESTLQGWLRNERSQQVGAPTTYGDIAIRCMLTLKAVFRLPLRQTLGLVTSLFQLMGLVLPLPHYSTLSRRSRTLPVPLPRHPRPGPLHVVVDSSGLKIYGEGEWRVRQHGKTKVRTWRKMHLGIDHATGMIVAQVLTERQVADHAMVPTLMRQLPGGADQFSGDGAYDYETVYRYFHRRRTRVTVPPRSNAAVSELITLARRNVHIDRIAAIGRAAWKRECGYHRRSLAETAMWRMKAIFGDRLAARRLNRQQTELAIRCAALNRMTQLGMPDSYAVTV